MVEDGDAESNGTPRFSGRRFESVSEANDHFSDRRYVAWPLVA